MTTIPKTSTKRILVLGLLLALFSPLYSFSSHVATKLFNRVDNRKELGAKATEFEFSLCYNFNTNKASGLCLRVNIPKSLQNRQKILNVTYSLQPHAVFRKDGNVYADFVFENPDESINLEINIKGELYDYDLSVASEDQNDLLQIPKDLFEYLQPERMIEVNHPYIQKAVEGIGGENRIEVVKNIYSYVKDHMEPDVGREESAGALQALKTRKGMCLDYCDLFVALCRAKNIPARVVSGYLIDYTNRPMHAWVEVYFENMGWVPFDTTWGEHWSQSSRKQRFSDLPPAYIYFTRIRNDKSLNYEFIYFYGYNHGHVDLKHSIKFKKPIARVYEGS